MEYDLGILLERLEKFEEAAAAFERTAAILDHPDGLLDGGANPDEIPKRLAEVLERIGRNLLEVRDFDSAVAAFQRAQAVNPSGAGLLHYSIAQIRLRQGKPNEAATALGEYLKLMPQGTDAYELMIGLMMKLKRDAEILPWLEQASDKDKFNVALRRLLARQCARAGRVEKAKAIYLDMANGGPTEDIYRELFVLYKDHYSAGGQLVAEMVSEAFQTATRKDNALINNPAPARGAGDGCRLARKHRPGPRHSERCRGVGRRQTAAS